MDAVGAALLTHQALVQTQLPPAYRRMLVGGTHVGAAGAPVIVGRTPRTSQERAWAHHAVAAAGRAWAQPSITGAGPHGGHGHGGHGHGGHHHGGPVQPVWFGPIYPMAPTATAASDCDAAASQAARAWAGFGVATVGCGTNVQGQPALIARATRPDQARRMLPPAYLGWPVEVAGL